MFHLKVRGHEMKKLSGILTIVTVMSLGGCSSPIPSGYVDKVEYFENIQSWMEASDRSTQYDFDENCINEGDYVRIETKEGESIGTGEYGKFENYTIYFFDCEAVILYYIHSNL